MKNTAELRQNISAVFADLRAKKIMPNVAKELNNCAGKIMQSAKLELEYASLRKEKPSIEFLRK